MELVSYNMNSGNKPFDLCHLFLIQCVNSAQVGSHSFSMDNSESSEMSGTNTMAEPNQISMHSGVLAARYEMLIKLLSLLD